MLMWVVPSLDAHILLVSGCRHHIFQVWVCATETHRPVFVCLLCVMGCFLFLAEVDRWEEQVVRPAERFFRALLMEGEEGVVTRQRLWDDMAADPLQQEVNEAEVSNNALLHREAFVCETCGGLRVLGSSEWQVHLGSRKHRRTLKRAARQEQVQAMKEKYAHRRQGASVPHPEEREDTVTSKGGPSSQ